MIFEPMSYAEALALALSFALGFMIRGLGNCYQRIKAGKDMSSIDLMFVGMGLFVLFRGLMTL